MKHVLRLTLLVFLLVIATGGEWVYRSFLRPVDPLQPDVIKLAQYFDQQGLHVRPYAIRHGFPHSEVVASAAFEIIGFPLPVAFDVCPNVAAADAHYRDVIASPNLTHPMRNGLLVMNLPMWGSDTGEMAAKVENIFASYQDGK